MWISAGVDFGNENLVLAIPRNGGVDVIPNANGSRLNPAVVCYTGDRRYYGEGAIQQQTMYTETTISQLKRLVSLPFVSKERLIIQDSVPFKLIEMSDGTTGVSINFHDKNVLVRPEQCIAFLMKKIDDLAKENESSVSEYVIAVSPWWPERQRRSLLNACKIANVNCMALVNSTTAAAVSYTMIHSKRLPEDKPVPVAFIDFGNSSMNVAIAMLKQGSVAIKSFADDDQLGGSHFTVALQNYLLEKVKQKYNIDPTSNKRAMIQFRNATEKLKKTLSINPVVQFEVLNIMDKDISFLVKREEFNSQIEALLERVTKPIDEALEKAGIKKEDLFAVEFLGGGSRVAAVKEKITEYFGEEPKRSLNLDECFAIGSAYMAALLNPATKINLTVKDVTPYAVEAEWSDGHIKQKELFAQFSEVPSTANLELKVVGTCDVKLTSNGDEICVVKIDTEVEDSVTVNLAVKLTQSSTVEIETASFKHQESEKAAKVTVIQKVGLTTGEIEELQKLEAEFEAADIAEDNLDNTKNELQAAYFSMLNILRDNKDFIDDEKLQNAEAKTNEIMMWYDENEFDKLPIEEYQSRLEIINNLKKLITDRINKFKEIKEKIPSLIRRLDSIINESKEYPELLSDSNKEKEAIQNISGTLKTASDDFTINDSIAKVMELENELKRQKEQSIWRAKKQQEEEIRQRRQIQQQNEEEELRRRIQEQEMQRKQLENEEDEYIDPFSMLFGQPMRRRQNLIRKQYDPQAEERRRLAEQERQREAQREAERRAELQRRAEEQRRQQLAAEQRRRQRAPWGFDEDDDDDYYQRQQQSNPLNQLFGGNPYMNSRNNSRNTRSNLRNAGYEDDDDDYGYGGGYNGRNIYREEPPQQRQRQQQQPRRQPDYDDGWGDPWGGFGVPQQSPRRQPQPPMRQPPSRQTVDDIWGSPWGGSGWRDPFF